MKPKPLARSAVFARGERRGRPRAGAGAQRCERFEQLAERLVEDAWLEDGKRRLYSVPEGEPLSPSCDCLWGFEPARPCGLLKLAGRRWDGVVLKTIEQRLYRLRLLCTRDVRLSPGRA